MSAFKAPRGAAVVVILAASLLLLTTGVAMAALPFAQQATLTASDEIGHSLLGSAVALDRDGDTVLVGGPQDNNGIGAVWVFTRRGSTWTQQAKLTGGGEIGSARFGTGVALSSDGETALIGGPADNNGLGAAWVFTRRGSTWTQRGSKLMGGGEIGEGEFGTSVALSSNGRTALIGGPRDNTYPGAAWVFKRSGSTWTQQGPKLTGSGETIIEEECVRERPKESEAKCEATVEFGRSVALSSNGNTALIGAPGDDYQGGHGCRPILTCTGGPRGAAWVFARSGSTWTQQGTKLTPTGGGFADGGVFFGTSVALSAKGNTALIGGPLDNWPNQFVGAAWVFARSGSTWTQQGAKLKNGELVGPLRGDERLGTGVALSSDGNTALIGSLDTFLGAWSFTRSGSTWTQQPGQLGCGGEGCGVALSGDGNTALVGTAVFHR